MLCRRWDMDGEPLADIARTYNVSRSTISRLTGRAKITATLTSSKGISPSRKSKLQDSKCVIVQ
jgi:transposase